MRVSAVFAGGTKFVTTSSMKRAIPLLFAFFLVACQGTLDMDSEKQERTSPYAEALRANAEDDESAPVDTPADSPADTTQPTQTAPAPTPEPAEETAPEPEPAEETAPEPAPEPEEETLPEPGSIVEFQIAEGTGTAAWNTKDDPVVVYDGQVLKITNFDNRNHRMHASQEAPVPHGGDLVPGQSEEYVVSGTMSVGDEAMLWDHNDGRSAAFWVEARPYP